MRDRRAALVLPLLLLLVLPASLVSCRSGAPEVTGDRNSGADRSEKGTEEDKKPRRPFRQVLPTVAFEMMHDSPTIDILDVRSPAERTSEGHINNSANFPFEVLKEDPSVLESLKGRTFLVFDSGAPGDERGRRAVLLLRSEGWREAVLLEGGLASWRRFGFGVVGGTVD